MSRVYNFSAGPAVLPEEVLKEAQAEMLDYKGTGMSVMEMSHRSKAFDQIIQEAEKDLRDLMHIPDNTEVRKSKQDCHFRRQDILLYPGLFRSSDQRRCRLCIHL